jgi:hypothetical protein
VNAALKSELRQAVRDGIVRALAVIGLAGIALIHLLDLPDTLRETPYLGALYLALMAGCGVLAAALVRGSASSAWRAAAGLSASVIAGYVLSRTTGLPAAGDDVGNWTEPLGMASLFAEGAVVALASAVLWARRAEINVAGRASRPATVRSSRPQLRTPRGQRVCSTRGLAGETRFHPRPRPS